MRVELFGRDSIICGNAVVSIMLEVRAPTLQAPWEKEHVCKWINVFAVFVNAIHVMFERPHNNIARRGWSAVFANEYNRCIGVLERRLDGRAWLAGENYSFADLASWPWILIA